MGECSGRMSGSSLKSYNNITKCCKIHDNIDISKIGMPYNE